MGHIGEGNEENTELKSGMEVLNWESGEGEGRRGLSHGTWRQCSVDFPTYTRF